MSPEVGAKHSSATIVELLEFTVFMHDPVLNSAECNTLFFFKKSLKNSEHSLAS